MKVFVAGATGAVGAAVVGELVKRGHKVTGLTRVASKQPLLEQLGATAVVADALDRTGIAAAVRAAAPEGVVSLLTSLPRNGPTRISHLEPTNRLREEGTRNVLAAATAAGAHRFVGESIVFIYGYGDLAPGPVTEAQPPGKESHPGLQRAIDAIVSCERQVQDATEQGRIEGVCLRFGLYQGAAAPTSRYMFRMARRRMLPVIGAGRALHPWIELNDAARAVADALERAEAGSVYNVVDDEPVEFRDYAAELARLAGARPPLSVPYALASLAIPYGAMFLSRPRLPVSNEELKRELGWRPQFPTYREALASLALNSTG
jgi:nucleoside-diphosphate-sugar epimerase